MTQPRALGDRYELGEVLGYGGMAEVHRGRDVRLGRDVAIKVLRSDLARDPTFQTRFRREAQAAAALNHPSIVAVYDTGEDVGPTGTTTPYIVMEYVEGQTLRDILNTEGPLDPQRALTITAEICAALDFSHRRGIVHRDVKPGNVMITPAGRVKVMDFGIARAVSDSAATMTSTAAVIGTAQYLSPEQARGESVDARSDVYAVGCVLYELLTGSPPFVGDSPVAVAYQHVREDPVPPSRSRPDLPPELDAIVLKALSKNPANRYQSAAEMREDIERAIAGRRVEATPLLSEEEATTVLMGAPATQQVSSPLGIGDEDAELTEDEEARHRRRKVIGFSLLGALVAAAIVAAFLLIPALRGDTEGPKQVAVPNLANMTNDQAVDALKKAGLQLGKVDQDVSSLDERDKVIKQDPPAKSKIDEGTKVSFTLGAGPETVQVPQLVGLSQTDAEQALANAGLVARFEQRDSGAQPSGAVVDSQPQSGQTAVAGQEVVAYISTGVVALPRVVGETQAKATQMLADAGFTNVTFTQVDSTTVPAGSVVSQDPSPDVQPKVSPGNLITLAIAKTPPPPPTTTAPPPTTSSPPTTSAPPTTTPPPTGPLPPGVGG